MAEKMTSPKASTNGSQKGKGAPKAAQKKTTNKEALTAREATLRAWQKTYANREKRLG